MKKFQLFFLAIFIAIDSLAANSDQPQQQIHEKNQAAGLQATCTIRIMKEKLSYANKQKDFDPNETVSTFKKLYDQCTTVINSPQNSPEQPNLSEQAWINKSFREISSLQQDDETRNCFNQTIMQVKQLSQAPTPDEKNAIIKTFFQNAENCSYQHALRVSLPHLEAQIQRWENNKENQLYDFELFSLYLKHTPDEKDDLQEDLQRLYQAHVTKITFDQFADNAQHTIALLKQDPTGRPCLENMIKFKAIYDAAQTAENKDNLKKDFAIPYLQCKNK